MIILPRGVLEADLRPRGSWHQGRRYRFPLRKKWDCLFFEGNDTYCRRSMWFAWPSQAWRDEYGDWWVAESRRESKGSICTLCKQGQKDMPTAPEVGRIAAPHIAIWGDLAKGGTWIS